MGDMTLEDVPVLGWFVGVGVWAWDLLISGGDLVLDLALALLGNVGLVVPLVTTLDRLASRYEFLPADLTGALVNVALVVLFAAYAVRLMRNVETSK